MGLFFVLFFYSASAFAETRDVSASSGGPWHCRERIELLMNLRLWSMNINHLCSAILKKSGPRQLLLIKTGLTETIGVRLWLHQIGSNLSLNHALVSSQQRDWLARFRVRLWLSRVKIAPSGLSPSLLMSPVKLQMICILQFPSLLCLCVKLATSFYVLAPGFL